MLNPFFLQGSQTEQNLVQDLINEQLRMYGVEVYYMPRKFVTKNTHGTGCTLSSAITCYYSCGKDLKESCELGIKYVNSAIKTNPKLGKGHGPINHLNSVIIKKI